jgi:hypothetical protein
MILLGYVRAKARTYLSLSSENDFFRSLFSPWAFWGIVSGQAFRGILP